MLTRTFDLAQIKRKLLFKKGATMVATSAAGVETVVDMTELAALGGVTASAAELNVTDGALDTNLVAAKAAILGTGGALTLGGALSATDLNGTGNATLGNAVTDIHTVNGEMNVIAPTAAAGNGIHVTQTPSATGKHNGVKVEMTHSGGGDDSNSAVRGEITQSSTAAIGNIRVVHGFLDMQAQPTSQGHTAAGYFEGKTTNAATNITGIVSLVHAGAAGGLTTPYINVVESGSTKSGVLMELGTGGAVSSGTADEMLRSNVSITNVNEMTHGLRIKVNGSFYYLVMIPAASVT